MKTEDVRDLLPSYAAGTLDYEQSRQVESLLDTDPALRKELAQWQVLRATVADVSDDEPEFRPELIEDMHGRIDAYEDGLRAARLERESRRASQSRPGAGPGGNWLDKILGIWDATPFATQIAVAAQFAVLAALIAVVSIGPSEEPGFTTASGGAAGLAAGQNVTVVFQPETTLDEVQALLERTGAQIVAGPSGQSAYTLNLGEIDDAEVASLLETLRSNNAVVRFAAPVE